MVNQFVCLLPRNTFEIFVSGSAEDGTVCLLNKHNTISGRSVVLGSITIKLPDHFIDYFIPDFMHWVSSAYRRSVRQLKLANCYKGER